MSTALTLPSTGGLLIVAVLAACIGYAAGAHGRGEGIEAAPSANATRGALCGQGRPRQTAQLRFESMTLAELEAMAIDVDARHGSDHVREWQTR